jgi:methionyl-tRNA formyltransferase
MRILYLGPHTPVLSYLRSIADQDVMQYEGDISRDQTGIYAEGHFDWLISYGHKHILPPWLVEPLNGRTANLHISYLPWNRGSQPNYWSWREDTPKGVSIHQITEGVDKGPLYAQRQIMFGWGETLATSHARLNAAMYALFTEVWGKMRRDRLTPRPQVGRGSFHDRAAFAAVKHTLTDGWHTPVSALREKVTA